ncbi:hypothetical protein L1286_13135 [Pseudoalteromonas sp. SMS1]|uniref:hypothetical protein n=1 Tax=Pseudoalteromonas sp. SMS1 TaxID=2908894 RepID=UPI001F24A758|nr:hypothetical protein [Pseudoalteromonas sp. SMS1]MCF2858425.1 hypothetical protein [Pseudoalteromonas sp. SMS1]
MFKNNYVVIALTLLSVLLVGCKSNNAQTIQAPKPTLVNKGERLSPYQLNNRFLSVLEQDGVTVGASSFIDANVTLKHYKEVYDKQTQVNGKVFTKGIIKGLKTLNALGGFNYLGTEEVRKGFWRSFYRLETEVGGALYFHLVWREEQNLTDVKFESLWQSILGFAAIANSQNKLAKTEREIFAKISESLLNKDFTLALSQLNSLSDSARENELVQITLLRLARLEQSEQSHLFVEELAKQIKPEHRKSMGWLDFYRRKKAYKDAFEVLNNAPEIIKNDAFFILEKSSIYLEVGDYHAVWQGIYDLFYLGGEDFVNYVFAAQLAIEMKEFEHAVQILSVAEAKYEVNLLEKDLAQLDDGIEFVNSAAFKKWRAKG